MRTRLRIAGLGMSASLLLTGCGLGSVYDVPLPGGADLGDNPYSVTVEFDDALDLVPQSAVKVNDLSVGRVSSIELDQWRAKVTVKINGDVDLPDNAQATIRQTSILGEKFVSLAPPANGATGHLSDGDKIPLARSGQNPEIEQVLSSLSLVLNGGGIDKIQTIAHELNQTLDGREPQMRTLLNRLDDIVGTADESKKEIVTALRQVNRLAKATDAQSAAIDQALDDLPGALQTVNDQRDDLVATLEALNDLSAVGTKVIKDSKAATLQDLADLKPILAKLAESGSSLVRSLQVLPTFPFPDAAVGGTPDAAKAYSFGDYANASFTFNTDFATTFAAMTPTERKQMKAALGGTNDAARVLAESAAAS